MGACTPSAHRSSQWGRPPTQVIGLDYGDWTEIDSALAQAYVVLDESGCPGCGQSLLRTTSPDAIGNIETSEVWCEACVQLDRDRTAQGDKEPPAGLHLVPVDIGNH